MENIFKNPQIDIDALPSATSIDWTPLHQTYLPISLIGTWVFGITLCIIFLSVTFFNDQLIEESWIIGLGTLGIILLFIFISIISILGFKHKAYALREHDILYKTGLIFRKKIALPFNRIQHSEINQGPIERNFNLSSLAIFTAGGNNSDLVIPGLLNIDAQNIKSYILEKTTQHE